MASMDVVGSSQQVKSVQVGWLGLRVHRYLALHSSNEPDELSQWLCYDDINSIMGIFATYTDAAHCYRLSSVVCRSVTLVSPAKMTEPIQMPFGLRTPLGPGNHVLDRGPDPHGKGQFFWERGDLSVQK